jgi:hypothetical protein
MLNSARRAALSHRAKPIIEMRFQMNCGGRSWSHFGAYNRLLKKPSKDINHGSHEG